MGNFKGSELLIVALLLVLLFGSKRLPDAARSIGRSLRIFKAETKGLTDSDATAAAPGVAPTPTPEAPTTPQTPPSTQA